MMATLGAACHICDTLKRLHPLHDLSKDADKTTDSSQDSDKTADSFTGHTGYCEHPIRICTESVVLTGSGLRCNACVLAVLKQPLIVFSMQQWSTSLRSAWCLDKLLSSNQQAACCMKAKS